MQDGGPWRLSPERSVLVVVDVQERLAPAIDASASMVRRIELLLRAAGELALPIVFTEHYPQGIGHTLARLRRLVSDPIVFEKIHFDACREPKGLSDHLGKLGRTQVVLLGCETHVCVLQTALGLRQAGFEVALVSDGCGSRRSEDKLAGLARMREAGCHSVSAEMVVFEWLERGDTAAFKSLLPAIRGG